MAVVLLAWAFHAIFHDQVRRLLDEQQIVLDAMPRAERWAVVWRMGPTHLWGTILQVDRSWLLVSIGFWGLTIVLGAWRWWLILRSQGLNLGLRRTLEISFVAHFFNSFLLGSTGGDLLKAYYAARVTHQRKTEAVTSVLIDRVLGLFVMLAFSGAMLLPNLRFVGSHPRTLGLAVVILGMLGAAGLLLLLSLRGGVSNLFPRARAWLHQLPKADRLERGLEACRSLGRDRGLLAQTVVLSVALALACIMQLLTLLWGYGASVPLTPLCFIVPAVICISALPVTPGGLGVRDNLYLYLLSLPEVGITPNTAVAVSLVAYAAGLVWSLLGGVLYVLMRHQPDMVDAVADGSKEERESGGPPTA